MTNKPPANSDMGLRERIGYLVDNLSAEKQQMVLEMLIELQQRERRQDSRIACLLAVDYTDQKRLYHDFIQNLSKGGVFIETREPLQLGQGIALTFTMPGSESHFKVIGKIARLADNGIGVQFESKLSRYQEEIIRTVVERKK